VRRMMPVIGLRGNCTLRKCNVPGALQSGMQMYLQRGVERYVESSPCSTLSRQDRAGNMRIRLLDLPSTQLPKNHWGWRCQTSKP